jgi:hypothetical protein
MIRYVTIRKFCELTGYTEEAIRVKIKRGVWTENRVWRKAPDGHILIHMEGFWSWVETGGKEPEVSEYPKRRGVHTKSHLSIGAFVAGKGLKLPLRPPTEPRRESSVVRSSRLKK